MAEDPIYLTQEGLEQLKERYAYLVNEARPAVSEKIKVARGFGDLSENAEYDAAKNEQMEIEQEIKDLNEKLSKVQIIDTDKLSKKKVGLGSTVLIHDYDFDEDCEYKIVGSSEVNLDEGKISNDSPLGAALIGRKKNDEVDVTTPGGVIKVKVLKIK